jgi:PKD repeat protein
VNLSQPLISADYDDTGSGINSSAIYIFIDGIEHTQNATISNSSITLVPPITLSEGSHTVYLVVTDNFGNTENATWTFYVDGIDPIAVAGEDRSSIEDEMVSFNGTLSTDENELYNFTWDFGDGYFGYGPTPQHAYPSAATYVVKLTVRDIANNSHSDYMNVFVENVAPIANAGLNQFVNEGGLVSFDGSGSTDTPSDVPNLVYYWHFPDGTVLSGISVDHTFLDDGLYEVILIVEDDNGFTDSDTLNVTVSNSAPIADIGGPYTGDEGSLVEFTGSATDPGDDTFTYEWDFDDDGLYNDGTGTNPSWTWYDEGDYPIGLKVTDDDGNFSFDYAVVTIDNVAPNADSGGPYVGIEGVMLSIYSSGSDPGADTLVYFWDLDFDGQYDDSVNSSPEWTWGDDGVYLIGLRIADGDGGYGYDNTTVTIQNANPTVDIQGSYEQDEELQLSLSAIVTDQGLYDTFTYLWDFGDGSVSSEVYPFHVYTDNGVYNVSLTVTDDDGGVGTDTATVTIANLNPQIIEIKETVFAMEDELFSLQIQATDTPGDSLLFTDRSDLFTIDPLNGLIEFTPTNSQIGVYAITIEVFDDDGGSDLMVFSLEVVNSNDPPDLDYIGPQIVYEDSEFNLVISANDPDYGDELTFSDDSDLFEIHSENGLITFTPTNDDVGHVFVTFTVTDKAGETASEEVLFTIINVNDAPVLTSIPHQAARVNTQFTYAINASDEDDEILHYSDDSDLFVIDPVTGMISFTPEKGEEGLHTIIITTTDSSGAYDSLVMVLDIEGVSEEPETDWLSIILFILLVIVIIILLIHLLSHRKKEEEEIVEDIKDEGELEGKVQTEEGLSEEEEPVKDLDLKDGEPGEGDHLKKEEQKEPQDKNELEAGKPREK